MVDCVICEEELDEHHPGVDNWMDDRNDITESFIVREMICDNEDCPLFEKQQDVFFDFTRIDIEGDEIEINKLKKEFKKVKK